MILKPVEKDILSGKYKAYYLVYNRKSTDDINNQKNSISYQGAENERFALKEKLSIAPVSLEGFITGGIISEKHSAFKENFEMTFGEDNTVQYKIERPKFYKLVEWLSKGYFRGAIFLCFDRACRNKGDEAIIRKLMASGVDIRFTLATYEKTSSGELHLDIDGMFSIHHSRVTREKVMMTIYKSRAAGLCVTKAPVGYLNQGNMNYKPQDPKRASIIVKLFEMYATGEWSLIDLARWAIEQGFTMSPARRHRTREEMLADEEKDEPSKIEAKCRIPTYNNIHKILTNPFYMGKVPGNEGKYVDSKSHKGLVSPELFEKVQLQLRKNNKSTHYVKLISYPFRKMVRCADCGRLYTPYIKKGIMYFGARCPKGCLNPVKNFNLEFLAKITGSLMERLSFTEEELADFDSLVKTDVAVIDKKLIDQAEEVERKKKKISEDLSYLNDNRLSLLRSGAYTPEMLATEETALNLNLKLLREKEGMTEISLTETVEEVIKLSELLKEALRYFNFANPQEKEQIIKVIFSELTLSGEKFDFRCKNGFQSLESRLKSCFVADGARGGS